MNYFNKKRVVIIVITVLLAVNIASISTIIYFSYHKTNPHLKFKKERWESFRKMWDDLKLTEDQQKIFKDSYKEYKINTQKVFENLYKLRIQIMDEFAKPVSDTSVLNALAEKTGQLHKELKMLTNNHLLRIKSVSNPEQIKVLEKMFRKFVENDRPNWYRSGDQKRKTLEKRD